MSAKEDASAGSEGADPRSAAPGKSTDPEQPAAITAGKEPKQESNKQESKPIRLPAAKSVGWALVQAARLHRTRVGDRLAALGLFAGQEQVVQALAVAGSMTMGDLAASLRVRPPTASKTISRLSALGFVERRTETGDGRIVRVRLTETGLAKAAAIERIWDEVENELLDRLDGKDKRRLRKLLRKAARGLAEAAGLDEHEADHEADAEIEEEEALLAPTTDGAARPS